MPKYDKKLIQESELVDNAMKTGEGKEKLVKYLTPLVTSIATQYRDRYCAQHKISLSEREEKIALSAGWTHLNLAIEKYHKKIMSMRMGLKKPYNFSTYFTWLIKQGVHEYLLKYRNTQK